MDFDGGTRSTYHDVAIGRESTWEDSDVTEEVYQGYWTSCIQSSERQRVG